MRGKDAASSSTTIRASEAAAMPEPDVALQSQLAATIEATPDGVALVDPQGALRYLNPAGRALLGIDQHERLAALTLFEFCPEAVQARLRQDAFTTASTLGRWSAELELTDRAGRTFPAFLAFFAHKESNAHLSFLSLILRDISEQKRREAELAHHAHHDALTGLFNRRRFQEELDNRLAQVRRYGDHGALLLLDVDGLKAVNDTFGHQAGDALLASLAQLLKDQLREVDIIARLGGDEFAVLFHTPNIEQAQAVAERLLNAVRTHQANIADHRLQCTVSIGVALFPDHGTVAESVVAHADLALYRAKAEGRDQYQMFTLAMER